MSTISNAICAAALAASIPVYAGAQQSPDFDAKLQKVEAALQKQAQEAHITGFGLAIVKDGKVVLAKGYGWRDAAHKRPVTADTLFAIGSSTKAFTAFTVEQEAEAKRLSLSDAPRKYVPTFRLYDKDADSKMTISDLMSHRCGLARTDFAMVTGKLSPVELLRVVADARPTAKFGEKFQYQNLMFMTAGMVVESIEHRPWTEVVASRIFAPLEMKRTNTSVKKTLADPDHSEGFAYDTDKKISKQLPMRDIAAVAPAGAINSSVREMTHWLQLMLNDGQYNGKRLLSSERVAELLAKHMSAGPGVDYGYGWFLRKVQNHPVMEHGGNIDGFSAQVALMPDQKLGFVLLTNENGTPFASNSVTAVLGGLLGTDAPKPQEATATSPAATANPAEEAGTYHLDAAGVDLTVAFRDGKLFLTVPGQPEYKLEPEGNRKYRLAGMAGFSVEFKSVKDKPKKTELAITQPNGNFSAVRDLSGVDEAAIYTGPDKDLIASYENENPHAVFPVTVKSGKVCFMVPGQPAYALKPIEGTPNTYRLGDLPEAFGITVKRDSAGKVTGMELKQPQGNLQLKRIAETTGVYNAEDIASKEEQALGSLTAGQLHALRIDCKDSLINEGVKATVAAWIDDKGAAMEYAVYNGAGKPIAATRQYFDGKGGVVQSTLSPDHDYSSKEIAAATIDSSAMLRPWKSAYKSVEVKRTVKVGSEEAYVLIKNPKAAGASPVTEYVSVKTYLPLKREATIASEIGPLPVTETYTDYRKYGQVMLPATTTIMVMGAARVRTIDKVTQYKALPAEVLKPVKGKLLPK